MEVKEILKICIRLFVKSTTEIREKAWVVFHPVLVTNWCSSRKGFSICNLETQKVLMSHIAPCETTVKMWGTKSTISET